MKIKFTTNTNLKLPEVLSDTDMKYGFSLYKTGEYTTLDTEDSFKVKLLSKLDNALSRFNIYSEDTKNAIESVAQVVDYTNKHIDSPSVPYIKVQVNTPTILNNTYGTINNLINRVFKNRNALNTDVHAGHIFRDDNIIILGTSLLKKSFSIAEANHGLYKVTQFIFFHELSHGIERECIHKYGQHQSNDLVSFKSKLDNLKAEPNYGNINHEISSNKLHANFAVIDKEQFKNLETLHAEHYADVSGLLYLREYEITKGTYNIESFTKFIDDIIIERHKEYENAKKALNEKVEDHPSSNVSNTLKAADHYTSASLEELRTRIPSLGNDKLGIEEIHKTTSQCAEKGYLKMIYALSTMHKEFTPVLNTLCSTFYNTESGRAYLETSDNQYVQFMQNLKDKVGHDWIEKYDNLTKQIKTEVIETDRWMEMCFKSGASLDKGASELKKHKEINEILDMIAPTESIQESSIVQAGPAAFSVKNNMQKMKQKYETSSHPQLAMKKP